LEDSYGGCSSRMNLADEDEFQPEILTTPMFNVKAFPSCVVLTSYFCHRRSHELGSCPYQSSQILLSNHVFVIPLNVTPFP